MNRLRKYSALLAAIQSADPRTRIGILRTAPDEFIKTILEVVINSLAGNITHSKRALQKLKPYKNILRSMRQTSSARNIRKKLIKQKGGFLPFLLAPVIAAAAAPAIASNVASKAARSATSSALDTVEERVKKFLK